MNETFDDFINKITDDHYKKMEGFSRDQFLDCLLGAIKSGDFQTATTPMQTRFEPGMKPMTLVAEQRVGMSYMPYREVQRLEGEVDRLKEEVNFYEDVIEWQYKTSEAIRNRDREYLKKNLFRFAWKDVL